MKELQSEVLITGASAHYIEVMAGLLPGLVCALLSLAWFMTWMWAWGAKKWSNYPIHPTPCIPQAWHIRLVLCMGWVSVPVAVRAVCAALFWMEAHWDLSKREGLAH